MDQAWQHETELQRQREILAVLSRVRSGSATDADAQLLALELGLLKEFQHHTEGQPCK